MTQITRVVGFVVVALLLTSPAAVTAGTEDGAAPGSVYVLSNQEENQVLTFFRDTGVSCPGTISGFRFGAKGLVPIPDSTRSLAPGAKGPSQVQFSPEGRWLVVTERGSDTTDTFPVGDDGRPGRPVRSPSAGQTPFGFEFDPRGHLVVSNAARGADGRASVTSYALEDDEGHVVQGFRIAGDGALTFLGNFGPVPPGAEGIAGF